ncbi:MAG: Hsp20/alpha crystallin family protein [Chloroflexi bacterium]|nr:Hsp20/alpha crystallin family protein [Chloroflexota bacterium]
MVLLTRYDPFREALSLRDAMDRLFQESFIRPGGWMPGIDGAGVPVDVQETEDAYVVTASLPGWKPESISIAVQNGILTISGEHAPAEQNEKGKVYHVRERVTASFSRSFTFPAPVDADKAEARYENGVLTLRLPKAERAKPRRIKLGTPQELGGPEPRN